MRYLRSVMLLFCAGVFLLLSTCGGLESSREELEPALTSADVEVFTYESEVNEKQVTLKAGIEVDIDRLDQQLIWGFMWFVDEGNTNREVNKLIVGKGFYKGHYKFIKNDFPSDKQIGFCAFVDFKASPNAEVEQILGEELWFDAK